jgi:putative ABC transport system permease protein
MVLTLGGIAIGAALSLGVARALRGLLFGVEPRDPVVLAAVALLLLAVSALACYLPARRASKLDPMAALRME